MTFQELLNELRVPVMTSGNKHCREGWIQIDCPFCSPGYGKYLMGYSLHGNYCNCYQCGGKPLAAVLERLSGKGFRECKLLLKGLEKPEGFRKTIEHTGKLVMPEFCEPMLKMHDNYLADRGFDPEYCERIWDFQGIGNHTSPDKKIMRRRVVIPIKYNGRTVSWTARAIDPDSRMRYISADAESEAIPHKELLFGRDFVTDTAIIVEGPLDAVRIGRGAVATCGIAYKQRQILEMSKIPYRYICFDSEPKAQQRAHELAELLSGYAGETHVVTLDAKDAAEATNKELKQLRKGCGLDANP
jgi:hypothetical protein